jgi:hypothetical protein
VLTNSNTTEAPPTRRRWYQFGLGAIFLVVTVLACLLAWVAYDLSWIQQRRQFLAKELVARDQHPLHGRWNCNVATIEWAAPALLGLLGEQGTEGVIVLVESQTTDELTCRDRERVARAEGLFPEAVIRRLRVLGSEPDTIEVWVDGPPLREIR